MSKLTEAKRKRRRFRRGPDYYAAFYKKSNWKEEKIQVHWFIYILLKMFIPSILRLFYRISFIGSKNVPRSGPVIVMSNHLSHMDSIMLGMGMPVRPPFFMADEKLYHYSGFVRFFSVMIRRLNTYPVRKRSKDRFPVEYSIKAVKDGNLMVYYPEGARNKNPKSGNLQSARIGAGWVAHETKATVVPAFLAGIEDMMPVSGGFRIGRGPRALRIEIIFGKPLNLRKYYQLPSGKETSQKITDEIMKAIDALKPADWPNRWI